MFCISALECTIASLRDNLFALCVKLIPVCITAGFLGTNRWPEGPHLTPTTLSHERYFHGTLDVLNWHFLDNIWIELWRHEVTPQVQNQRVKTPLMLHSVSGKQRLPLNTAKSWCSRICLFSEAFHSVKTEETRIKSLNYPRIFSWQGLSNPLRSLPLLYWICMFCFCGFTVPWLVVGLDSLFIFS